MDIYIARGEERNGPYSEDSIRQFLTDGQLDGTELAWHEGLDEWVALSQIIEGGVQEAYSAQPPLKVPTQVVRNSPEAEAAIAKKIDRATEKPGFLFFFKKPKPPTWLVLSNNPITYVSPLKELTQLTKLYLIHDQISESDIKNLQEALPNCSIHS